SSAAGRRNDADPAWTEPRRTHGTPTHADSPRASDALRLRTPTECAGRGALGARGIGRTEPRRTHGTPPTECAGRGALAPMTRKVLVVDDDAAILEVLAMRLGAMGFDVTPVGEPRRALDVAAAQRFDLALI